MRWLIPMVLLAGVLALDVAAPQPLMRYKLALVALTENPEARIDFENGLTAKFRANDYDAFASHEIIPEVADLDDADVVRRLADAGVRGIVVMKPAAVGPGSSLESVRDEVRSEVYADMRSFAREISPSHDEDDLIAVMHTASYVIRSDGPELISSGAVWLDEPVETQQEGVDKLQDLIVANMNKARPAFREHLGLPPLTEQ